MSIILAGRHNSRGTFLKSEYYFPFKTPACYPELYKRESTGESYINFLADRGRYLVDSFCRIFEKFCSQALKNGNSNS